MTIFAVRHLTTYSYRRKVHFGEHRLMFRPRDSYDQRLLTSSLITTPEAADVRWVHDVFGNCVANLTFEKPASELRIETNIRLEHTPDIALDLKIDEEAKHYPFTYDPLEMPDLERLIERQYPDTADRLWLGNRKIERARKYADRRPERKRSSRHL